MSKIPLKIKLLFVTAIALYTCFYFCLPSKLFNAPTCFVIEDKDGNLLNASIAADGQWRFPYDENVPDKFIKCITTFEDKRFYSHPGVDVIAFCKSSVKKFKK